MPGAVLEEYRQEVGVIEEKSPPKEAQVKGGGVRKGWQDTMEFHQGKVSGRGNDQRCLAKLSREKKTKGCAGETTGRDVESDNKTAGEKRGGSCKWGGTKEIGGIRSTQLRKV